MNLWIPGARGLVGSALSKEAKSSFQTGREIDIADFAAVFNFVTKNKITHIINCAAFSEVDPAELEEEAAFRANALGPENLGRIAKQVGARLVHLSTDYIFDGNSNTLMEESAQAAPCNNYGKSKWEGEKRLLAAFPEACILRTSWVFGRGGKCFTAKILELLQTKEELKLVDDQISRPTYAVDLARALLQMQNWSGIYHFANHGPTTKYAFTLALIEEMKRHQFPLRCKRIVPVPSSTFSTPAKRPLYSALDTRKIESMLDFPLRHWSGCLSEYLHEL